VFRLKIVPVFLLVFGIESELFEDEDDDENEEEWK
jgi:hypothetical protein